MMKPRFWALALLLSLSVALPARAQNLSAKVVSTCGTETLPTTAPNWLRMSVSGLLCINGTFTGTVTGAITIVDGGDVGEGATTATAATAGSVGSVNAKLRLITTQLDQIKTALNSPFQAGGSIGNTTFAVTNAGTFAAQATLAAETTKVIGTVNQGTSPWVVSGTVTASAPAADPCQANAATYTPISITSATTTRIVAPTSSKRTYVCYLFLLSAIANNVGIVEGTGGTCGSSTAGVVGGTTAANGINLAANSGAVFQAGGNVAIATAGTNVDLCLITSAVGPIAGHIKWVQAP